MAAATLSHDLGALNKSALVLQSPQSDRFEKSDLRESANGAETCCRVISAGVAFASGLVAGISRFALKALIIGSIVLGVLAAIGATSFTLGSLLSVAVPLGLALLATGVVSTVVAVEALAVLDAVSSS